MTFSCLQIRSTGSEGRARTRWHGKSTVVHIAFQGSHQRLAMNGENQPCPPMPMADRAASLRNGLLPPLLRTGARFVKALPSHALVEDLPHSNAATFQNSGCLRPNVAAPTAPRLSVLGPILKPLWYEPERTTSDGPVVGSCWSRPSSRRGNT